MPASPYVVGQWVRGEYFYGRGELIDLALRGRRNWLWLLGTRRMGKTSMLKQLEHLAVEDSSLGYFPVFWDFQGADNMEEFKSTFADAMLDAEDRMLDLGLDIDALEGNGVFEGLRKLRRQLRPRGLKLLLLCDEVEELIPLSRVDPTLLRKLRRLMQSQEDIRSVLASTIRLWELAGQESDTSPFLHGFLPPVYIQRLVPDDSRALIQQTRIAAESRPKLDPADIETIREHCDDHPYLMQLVCTRYLERGDIQDAIQEVAGDPMVSYFFSVDFQMLSPSERNILRIIADHTTSTSESIRAQIRVDEDGLRGQLDRLENLGFIRRDDQRRFKLVNHFFKRWFGEQAPKTLSSETGRHIVFNANEASFSQAVTISEEEQRASDVLDDRYELTELVGQGAAGMVYKAFDRMLRVTVAVKILKPQYAVSPEAFERFRQEIVLTREISHPNILRVFHLGQDGDRRYLTMQWVEGPDLAHVIKRTGAFSLERARAYGMKLSSALEALHKRDILHRDIKPQNILVHGTTDEPLLTDFGLARLLTEPGMTSSGIFLGTPEYASPEQARLLPLDQRADLYALGLILFELSTGKRPFSSDSKKRILDLHRAEPPPSPKRFRADLPDRFCRIVLRCLEKDPAQRFESATALLRALERLPVAPG